MILVIFCSVPWKGKRHLKLIVAKGQKLRERKRRKRLKNRRRDLSSCCRKQNCTESRDFYNSIFTTLIFILLRSTFTSFSTKWAKDSRFKAVEKMKDREAYFKDYIEELYKKEKEEKKREREKVLKIIFKNLKDYFAGKGRVQNTSLRAN